MRGGMAKHIERVGIFFSEDLQLDVVIERATQIDQFAGAVALVAVVDANRGVWRAAGVRRLRGGAGRWIGDARDERSVGEARRNLSRDIRRSCALRYFLH